MEAATKKGQRTKQRICDATLELIHKKGYPNVTIADICQAAGASNGSFFHYFKTKDDVLVAFVENESAELIDYCESLDKRGVTNAIDRLRLVMQWQASYYALKGEEFIAHLYSHIIRNKQQAKLDYSMASVLRECFAQGQQQGLFNERLTPQQMAEALFNSVLSVTAFTEWGQGIEQRLCDITEEFIKAFAPCDRKEMCRQIGHQQKGRREKSAKEVTEFTGEGTTGKAAKWKKRWISESPHAHSATEDAC